MQNFKRGSLIVGALLALACAQKTGGGGSGDAGVASGALGSGVVASAAAPSLAPSTEASANAALAKPFVPAHPVPAFSGKFPHRDHPAGAIATRVVEVRFARKGGENDVAPLFTLKNLTDKKISVGQTWLFYYDATTKKSDRYPHSLGFTLDLGPGESKEQRLGRNIKDIPAEMTRYEGEVTSARVDGASWQNQNLNPMPRPAGGVSPAGLAASAGERLIVDVYALGAYKVRLTNVTDRPIKDAQIALHYGDAKGENTVVRARLHELKEPIAAGQSVDAVVEPWSDSNKHPPAKATAVTGFAPRVDFADSTTFRNENLEEDFEWPKTATK